MVDTPLNRFYKSIVVQLQKWPLLIGGKKVIRWNLVTNGFVSMATLDA